MISDLLTSFLTPCSPYIRGIGYLAESLDMRRRAKLNAAAWQPHLDRSRSFILTSAERCRARDTVTILGSGLLLDVPLAELSGMFREVVLMDVICFPEIRKEISRYNNVRFVEFEVTGVADRMFSSGDKDISDLPEPAGVLPEEVRSSGLVVSLNILSQLWVVPRAYASKKMRGQDEYAVDEWCGKVVVAHYAALKRLSCDVCLIADHGFVKRNNKGEVISRGSSVYGLGLPKPDAEWTWNIVPPDGRTGTVSKELIVGAWHFNNL